MAYDMNKFRELLSAAIGSRRQNEFAEVSGISKSRLNHLLNDDTIGQPQKVTLQKIAEASQGRVTEGQLLSACGYPVSPVQELDALPAKEAHIRIAKELRKGVMEFAGVAAKYASLDDMLETVELLYGSGHMTCRTEDGAVYTGKGRRGAERYAHCCFRWTYKDFTATMPFILFYFRTEGGGVVVADCAFDLLTLMEMQNAEAQKFLMSAAEKGDVAYTDYPMVMNVSRCDSGEAERRLLKALFGDAYEPVSKKEKKS